MIQPTSQKRKEPNEIFDLIDDQILSCHSEMNQNIDCEMREISNKLKKVVCVDDSINRFHSISRSNTPDQLKNLMSIKIDTGGKLTKPQNNPNQKCLSAISDHLRKHSNSLVRIKDNNSTPNLKVKFIGIFSGCFFPIGVSEFINKLLFTIFTFNRSFLRFVHVTHVIGLLYATVVTTP